MTVQETKIEIVRQAQTLAERVYALKREELEMEIASQRARAETGRIELANLEIDRKQLNIVAPMDGVVIRGDVKVGDVLDGGNPVLEIAEQRGFHFEVTILSDDVADLNVGMIAQIRPDSYDFQKYGTVDGKVCFITPDSGVLEDSRGQQTAVYTIKISLDRTDVGRGDHAMPVKLGMTGQAEIVIGQERILSLFLKKIRRTIRIS